MSKKPIQNTVDRASLAEIVPKYRRDLEDFAERKRKAALEGRKKGAPEGEVARNLGKARTAEDALRLARQIRREKEN